jgi:hypothetical protein
LWLRPHLDRKQPPPSHRPIMPSARKDTATQTGERRAPLLLESDAFWYGASPTPSPTQGMSSGEWAHLISAVILFGVGLTSCLWALTGEREAVTWRDRDQEALAQQAKTLGGPLLLVGWEQEEALLGGVEGGLLSGAARPALPAAAVGARAYWVLSKEGELPEVLPEGWSRGEEARRGHWVLERWTAPDVAEGGDLMGMLGSARAAYLPEGGGEGPAYHCDQWRFGRRLCGTHPWLWFGVEALKVRNEQVQCIWAHPLQGHAYQVTFAPMDVRGGLRGRFALGDSVAENPAGGVLTLRVLVNGEEMLTRQVGNRKGWQPFILTFSEVTSRKVSPALRAPVLDLVRDEAAKGEVAEDEAAFAVDLSGAAAEAWEWAVALGQGGDAERLKAAQVTFEVTATHDGQRHFCFQAEVMPPPKGGAE